MSWNRVATVLVTELLRAAETAEQLLNAVTASKVAVEISALHCLVVCLVAAIAWHALQCTPSRMPSLDDRVRGFRLRINRDTCVLFADPDRRRVRDLITPAEGGGFEIDDDARTAVMHQSIQSGALGDRTCELVVENGRAFDFDMPVERVLDELARALQRGMAWLNLQQSVQKTPP